jgi:hypothetical protein
MFGDVVNYKERPAKDQRGFLLYSPYKKTHFFRVYDGENFTDYDLFAEEIEIQISGDSTSLYTSDENNKLDFSSTALGKE